MKTLSDDTIAKLQAALDALQSDIDAANAFFEAKSERWQESEKGTNYGAWTEALESVASSIEDCPHAPE